MASTHLRDKGRNILLFFRFQLARGHSYKTFYGRNFPFSLFARVFVPGKPFQPSLMFAGKAGAYWSEAPFQLLHFREGSRPHPQTVNQAGKACFGETL
jgi:hypothetical protein